MILGGGRAGYESRDVRADFRHNVQRTDFPLGDESRLVNASLPAKRSAGPWRDLFDLRGALSAVGRFLRGARAVAVDIPTREMPWCRVSVLTPPQYHSARTTSVRYRTELHREPAHTDCGYLGLMDAELE